MSNTPPAVDGDLRLASMDDEFRALAAELVREDHGAAAVGTDILAELHQLRYVRERIEDQSGVETRYAIVGKTTAGDAFRTRPLPVPDPTLVPTLRQKGVTVSARAEEGSSIWAALLVQSLPFLLFIGIAFFVVRQMQKNSGAGGAMGFGKSRAKMLTQKEGRVTFDDVAGIDEARKELQEAVEDLDR